MGFSGNTKGFVLPTFRYKENILFFSPFPPFLSIQMQHHAFGTKRNHIVGSSLHNKGKKKE